jgi:hypothetical protein
VSRTDPVLGPLTSSRRNSPSRSTTVAHGVSEAAAPVRADYLADTTARSRSTTLPRGAQQRAQGGAVAGGKRCAKGRSRITGRLKITRSVRSTPSREAAHQVLAGEVTAAEGDRLPSSIDR